MLYASMDLLFFAAKFLLAVLMLLLFVAGIFAIAGRGKKASGKLTVRDLNGKYQQTRDFLLSEILPKKEYRAVLKKQKKQEKQKKGEHSKKRKEKTAFVLHFNGDIRASAVCALREEVNAILGVAEKNDEAIVCLESSGGMVHAYGLGTDQLLRLREKGIRLTVLVDRIAASGGYMMACVADHLVAAPFAMIGSIGVVLQLPNFHRLLKERHVDFEQITAGRYKRTLSLFGHNTDEGREKSREEIEAIHTQFQTLVSEYRKKADIEKVTTGEHWTGAEALSLKLVDELGTSDDYLMKQADKMKLLEIRYCQRKSVAEKLAAAKNGIMGMFYPPMLP